jgi:outer membrane protein OmpA-like peptidoglycan-associated protein
MKRLYFFLFAFFTLQTAVFAQSQPSKDEIVRALEPPPGTRSLRGITVEGGLDDKPPSINLQISFEYDSDKLTTEGILTLQRLGSALKDPRLANYRFKVAGHTDAKGAADYNQKLSERRAKAVVKHLLSQYQLNPGRLDSVGYGESQLADPSKPEDGVNRRVQLINLGR